ncbi:hypothetical protein [Paraburkholderia strydomiana]|uniref:hypothetical protein n=1 Tax=Paraburkholderia strydomiana TaxID=1245417 RepID=UPI002035BC22|nr:hypothetical protein [Paraburkholderia strydomiana]
MEAIDVGSARRVPWNKGKLTGQEPALKLREIWATRIRLQLARRTRDLALSNLAIDSKLRACDLTRLRVSDICLGSRVAARATIMQQKTRRPVQFEITEQTRTSVKAWMRAAALSGSDYLFRSRIRRILANMLTVITSFSCLASKQAVEHVGQFSLQISSGSGSVLYAYQQADRFPDILAVS